MAAPRHLLLLLLLLLLHGVPPARGAAPTFKVWHFTDVHVDPYYVVGSDASKCYCETTDSCQVTGSNCGKAKSPAAAAEVFGNSEGNCATPQTLFESATKFMARQAPDAKLVYFTGDFAEAGASYACHGSERVGNESRGQING